jgi:hypothetical protein
MRLIAHTEWQDTSAGLETGRSMAMLEKMQFSAAAVLRLLYPQEEMTRHSTNPRLKMTRREKEKLAPKALRGFVHESNMSCHTWECESVHDPNQRILCVPARNTLGYNKETELSSTAIRAILQEESQFQQSPTLYGMTLNPRLLAKMVEAKRTWQLTPRQQEVVYRYLKSLEAGVRPDAQASGQAGAQVFIPSPAT